MGSLLTIPCSTRVVLSCHTSESKGRVDNCVWKKSKEIPSLLLGLKDEGDSTKQKWRQRSCLSGARVMSCVSQHGWTLAMRVSVETPFPSSLRSGSHFTHFVGTEV